MCGIHSRISKTEPLAVAAVVSAFYWPLLNPTAMQSGGDAANLFWPIKLLLVESAWGDGVIPLWNHWSFMGAPLVASLQHAVYYPPDWLLYALLPAHVAMNLGNLFHLILAGVGMWLWLRVAMERGAWASVTLGAAFPCAAWFWGHQEHINQVAAAGWIPLMAATAWLFLRARLGLLPFVAAYSMMTAVQFMTGHPQEAFYGHLLVGFLAIWRLVSMGDWAARGRAIAGFLIAGFIAGLLIAVQLLPTLELSRHSRRQFRDPLYAISFSMPPDVLLSHFNPHREGSFRDGYFLIDGAGNPVLDEAGNPGWNRRAFGEYGVHVGVPVLLLVLIAFILDGPGRRRHSVFLSFYILTVLLALGGNTAPSRLLSGQFTEFPEPGWSLHEMFLRLFPPAQGFRVPSRILLVGNLALLTIAAGGLDALRRHQRHSFATLAVSIAVIGALLLPSRREKFHHPAAMEEPLTLLRLLTREERTLDARAYRLTMSDDDSLIRERHLETTFGRGNPIAWRMSTLQPHMNVPARVPMVDGYEEGLVPTARFKDFLHDFNRNLRQFRPDEELLALLGVRHILAELPVDESGFPADAAADLPRLRAHRVPLFRGAAFAREGLQGIDFARLDGPFWRGGAPLPGINREQVAFGRINRERWQAQPLLTTALPSTNRIDVDGQTTSAGALLAIGWYPGWVIEGRSGRQPLEFASAVHAILPAEESARQGDGWRLHFRPRSHLVGLFLTALGAAAWAFVMALRRWKG